MFVKICVVGIGDFGECLCVFVFLSLFLLGMMVIFVFGLLYCKICIVLFRYDKGRLIVCFFVEYFVLLEIF